MPVSLMASQAGTTTLVPSSTANASRRRGASPSPTICAPARRRTSLHARVCFEIRTGSRPGIPRSRPALPRCSSESSPSPLAVGPSEGARSSAGRLPAVGLAASLACAACALEVLYGDWSRPVFLAGYLGSGVGAAALGRATLPLLQCVKAGQVVRLDGPPAHVAAKSGTPTMGGISFVPVGAAAAILLTQASPVVVAICAATAGYAMLGAVDDAVSMIQRSSRGVSVRGKMGAQLAVASLFVAWVYCKLADCGAAPSWMTASLHGGWHLCLGQLLWPLAVFVMTAESNAVNLTDGLDGLAAGTSGAAFMGLALAVMGAGVLPTAECVHVAAFCCCMAGACMGFLTHNHNKAIMFMGDTGSLALGGALGAAAIATGPPVLLPLLIITALFAAEAVSVMLQVGYYKATKGPDGKGKRLFRMAPFHHHLELSGWSEVKVVKVFYVCALILAGLGGLLPML
mmetsp:Transcript_2112/g.4279  ORF Transcript_2112/g.4279 Transcript_2112/m.4279 type:complete len:458 (+) Transcript_2112:405-1778(+)